MAYETTEVAVEKSQGEIRKLLYAHGARNFSFTEAEVDGVSLAAVDFVHQEQRVRVRVPLKPLNEKFLREKIQRAQTRTAEEIRRALLDQEAKRIWRVLFHGLKARLVSVQEGVETFEEAFLAHLVDPVTGITMWEAVKGAVDAGALKMDGPGLMTAPLRELVAGTTAVEQAEPVDDDDVVDAEVIG